jgi:CcmD family protein
MTRTNQRALAYLAALGAALSLASLARAQVSEEPEGIAGAQAQDEQARTAQPEVLAAGIADGVLSAVAVIEPPPGFERVSRPGSSQAETSALPLVVAAYMVIWVLLVVYLLALFRRQRNIHDDLIALREAVERANGGEA